MTRRGRVIQTGCQDSNLWEAIISLKWRSGCEGLEANSLRMWYIKKKKKKRSEPLCNLMHAYAAAFNILLIFVFDIVVRGVQICTILTPLLGLQCLRKTLDDVFWSDDMQNEWYPLSESLIGPIFAKVCGVVVTFWFGLVPETIWQL